MSFSLDIMKFTKKLRANGTMIMRKSTFDMYGGLVAGTRVDTGRARANWNVSLDAPKTDTRQGPTRAPEQGSPPNSIESRGGSFQTIMMQIKAGKLGSIYVANSLPYIFALEKLDSFVHPVILEVKRRIEAGVYL